MYKLRRNRLSQNFLRSPKLVKRLIGRSSIANSDLVIEIGPGKGVITTFLIERAKTVIAIEQDPVLYSWLTKQFRHRPNFNIIYGDFLSFQLPEESYKVFANIPFSIEGKIIRKLIDAPNPPEDCYLILRKEVAERLAGVPRNGQFSILHKPWFQFEIFHRFRRSDFFPKPRVESVMLRFLKRPYPLLPESEKLHFQQFVTSAFGGGRRIRQNLNLDAKPSDLSLAQWLSLYRYMQHI